MSSGTREGGGLSESEQTQSEHKGFCLSSHSMVPKKEDGEFEVNLVTHRDPVSKPNTSEIPCARPSKSSEAWRSWRNGSHTCLSDMT